MLVSYEWLSQYCPHGWPPEELARLLGQIGLKVEGIEKTDTDTRFNIETLTSRPDTLGLIGIAREVHAATGAGLRAPEIALKEAGPAASELTSVNVEDFRLCPQYTARIIRDVRVGPSPEWMQRRLRVAGIAPINNIVDITNYVMMEYSQPLHAFDFERLAGRRIIVRRAEGGEGITTIDHNRHTLSQDVLVIADAGGPVAIAGVMGGLDTEVSPDTRTVLLESAEFDRLSIRGTARKFMMDTEASYRFERGIDPNGVEVASRRAAQLISELAGGKVAAGVVWPRVPRPGRQPVTLRAERLSRLLGVDVPSEEAVEILRRLGFLIQTLSDEAVTVLPPSWRRDVEVEVDLIEEVARIRGYDKIPNEGRLSVTIARRSAAESLRSLAREVLVGAGYNEAMTLTLVSREVAELISPWTSLPPMEVRNPVRADEPAIRKSLLPSLLTAKKVNQDNGNYVCRLFELAAVFVPQEGKEAPSERSALAILADEGFHDLKGTVELFLRGLNLKTSWSFDAEEMPFFKPGRSARIVLGAHTLGVAGEAATAVCEAFRLRSAPCLCEIDLSKLVRAERDVPRYRDLDRIPPATRDMSLVLDERTSWKQVEDCIWEDPPAALAEVNFLSEFSAPQLGRGKKALAFSLLFRGQDRTLTGEEADGAAKAILARLSDRLGGTLRQS